MSRFSNERIQQLGYTPVERDLPPIVRDWCIGDEILCLIEGEFSYASTEIWKCLKPVAVNTVLQSHTIFAGMVVVASASADIATPGEAGDRKPRE